MPIVTLRSFLSAYRHGLRASEVADLEWSQVELGRAATPHVRRAKNGKPSAHPLRGDEVRALRELHRQAPDSAFVFATERGGPFTLDAINRLIKRIGARARFAFPVHAHMLRHACGYALANAGHDTRLDHEPGGEPPFAFHLANIPTCGPPACLKSPPFGGFWGLLICQ
jgi:integrase